MKRIVAAIIFSVLASIAFSAFADDRACTNQVKSYMEGLELVAEQPYGVTAQKADWAKGELKRVQSLRASGSDCATRDHISLLTRSNDAVQKVEAMMRAMSESSKQQ